MDIADTQKNRPCYKLSKSIASYMYLNHEGYRSAITKNFIIIVNACRDL